MDFMFSVPLTIFLRVTDIKNAVAQAIKNGKTHIELVGTQIMIIGTSKTMLKYIMHRLKEYAK